MGTVLLRVRIGKLCIRAWLGIAANLSIDLYLGMSLIDRYKYTIFLGKYRLVPWHSTPDTIIMAHKTSVGLLET